MLDSLATPWNIRPKDGVVRKPQPPPDLLRESETKRNLVQIRSRDDFKEIFYSAGLDLASPITSDLTVDNMVQIDNRTNNAGRLYCNIFGLFTYEYNIDE